jgi:hypothetical protein
VFSEYFRVIAYDNYLPVNSLEMDVMGEICGAITNKHPPFLFFCPYRYYILKFDRGFYPDAIKSLSLGRALCSGKLELIPNSRDSLPDADTCEVTRQYSLIALNTTEVAGCQ